MEQNASKPRLGLCSTSSVRKNNTEHCPIWRHSWNKIGYNLGWLRCSTSSIIITNHTRQSPYTTTLNKHGRELASKNWFRVARRESGAATKMRTKKIPPKRDLKTSYSQTISLNFIERDIIERIKTGFNHCIG